MDRFKGLAKGGWHPSGDMPIHRESWKSDLKNMATGKKKDPYEAARNHESRPLATLKDPDSFGPPPKHSAYYPNAASPTSSAGPQGGLGSAVPTPSRRQQEEAQAQEEAPKPPPVPYRADTTGLRTDNLPKPPVRRTNVEETASPVRTASPTVPPRQTPTLPARQSSSVPPPVLPPRMTEHPNEYTPPPPPTYGEAVHATREESALINPGAAARLGQVGISVPALGIGAQPTAQPRGPQLSELQQRFARMSAGADSQPSVPSTSLSPPSSPKGKKPAPPPPPKRIGLTSDSRPSSSAGGEGVPPPVPLSSKPKPG